MAVMIVKAAPLRRNAIKEKILKMISDSSMQTGDRLLSEKKLSEILNANHLTIRAALAELKDQGIVESISGSGTFYTGKQLQGRKEHELSIKPVSMLFRNDAHFFGELQNEILLALQKDNFMVSTQCPHLEEPEILADLEQFFSWHADSIIVSQTEIEKTVKLCTYFNEHAVNCRWVIRLLGNLCCDISLVGHLVTVDYGKAYLEAVQHLKSLGHQRIGFFGGLCDGNFSYHKANRKYISLYADAMAEVGLAEHISIICQSDGEALKKASYEILQKAERPTAFLCMTDHRGVILTDVAKELGMRLPEDLSIIGFYDTPWSHYYNLSSFRVRNKEIADIIAGLFGQDQVKDGMSLVPADFIDRNSTAAPAGS